MHPIACLQCIVLATGVAADPPPEPPNPALAMAREVVPKTMASRQSEHFVLLTDADLASADVVLKTLESAYRNFHAGCESYGVRPGPIPHRLVAVLFRDQADYQRFNQRFSPDIPEWVVGFYDPRADRLVMFDHLSRSDVQKGLVEIAKNRARLEREVAASGIGPAQTGKAGNTVDQARMLVDRDRQRLESDARDGFIATVAHEATHGLCFGTGVQSRTAGYPFWLSEGLATNNEPQRADERDFGFRSVNPSRRQAFEEAIRESRMPSLAELVMYSGAPAEDERGEVGRLYAAACFFTKWLARERPTELRLYLASLRDGSWSDAASRMERFEAIFGPVDALERSWMRDEARAWTALMATPAGDRLRAFERTAVRAAALSEGAAGEPAADAKPASPPGK